MLACKYSFHLEGRFGEVQQKTVIAAGCAEIGTNDSEVFVDELFDSLELDNDFIRDEQIDTVESHLDASIYNGHRELTLETKATVPKLHNERGFVYRLQESRAERTMNLNGRTDDFSGELFMFEFHFLAPFLHSCIP